MRPSVSIHAPSLQFRDLLVLSATFGLLTGLVGGLGLWIGQELSIKSWETPPVGVETIWISPLFNLLLFLAVGAILAPLLKLPPAQKRLPAALFVFAFLTSLNWLLLPGRLNDLGCVVLALGLTITLLRWCKGRMPSMVLLARRALPALGILTLLSGVLVVGGGALKEKVSVGSRATPPAGSPNVILIVVDALRADHLSSLGYSRKTSPQLDRIAADGALFENAISTSSWTLPSHVSLLTGRYPYQHGGQIDYDGRHVTLGEKLQTLGYRTAVFSGNKNIFTRKHYFGRGFDSFHDFYESFEDAAYRTTFGFRLVTWIYDLFHWENHPGRKSAPVTNRQVLDWVQEDPHRPFFAFLNYFDAHDPYLPPPSFRTRFSGGKDVGGIINIRKDRGYLNLPADQLASEMAAYDGAIAYVDHHIGLLLEELERLHRLQNTIVLITSDHGEAFGEHGLTTHVSSLHLELIRVPIIIRAPGRIAPGTRVHQPVSIASLPNTVLDLLGVEPAPEFLLPSLAPLWSQPQNASSWEAPLSELAHLPFPHLEGTPAFRGESKSLVGPQWHYIWHEALGEELYAWTEDPREQKNLAHTPEGRAVCESFRAQLASELKQPAGAQAAH